MKKRRILIVSIAAVILAAGAILVAWLQGAFLPGWIRWEKEKTVISETPAMRAELRSAKVTLYVDEVLFWESPSGCKVQDVLLCDINHDGEDEILLLCWKIGRYGKHKPFYIKEDEKTWSQHIFIYSLDEDRVKAEWMASILPVDVAEWSFREDDRLTLTEPSGRKTRWDWLQWGLEILEESQ